MDNNLNNKHLRNAETQMAVDLGNAVKRFISSKKHRVKLSETILVKARELAQASLLLGHVEPPVNKPIPPLASAAERRGSNEPTEIRFTKYTPATSHEDFLSAELGYLDAEADYKSGETLESLYATTHLNRPNTVQYDKGILRFLHHMKYEPASL